MSHEYGPSHQERIEFPPNVEALIGMLAMNLSIASRDTGKSYYVEFSPVDPALPDVYQVDGSIQEPRGVFRSQH